MFWCWWSVGVKNILVLVVSASKKTFWCWWSVGLKKCPGISGQLAENVSVREWTMSHHWCQWSAHCYCLWEEETCPIVGVSRNNSVLLLVSMGGIVEALSFLYSLCPGSASLLAGWQTSWNNLDIEMQEMTVSAKEHCWVLEHWYQLPLWQQGQHCCGGFVPKPALALATLSSRLVTCR